MQEEHFDELKHGMADDLRQILPEEAQKGAITKMQERMDRMAEENKLLLLPPDEVQLLLAFRNWKGTSNAATGVFHFKVQK